MLVNVVIPAREWDVQLEATLASLAAQDLPDDVTLETIVGLAGPAPSRLPAGVQVVHNPSGTIPDALNLAIGSAAGAVVVRVDSRCNVQSDHVRRVLSRLEDPDVGCVGGAQLVLDRGVFGSAYAVAFNSALLGPSRYRYSRTSGPVETAYLGAWRRSDLERLGGFDPMLIRNQDNELADRVRASGQIVWYDSDLVVGYRNGRTFFATLAHHHEFGVWRMLQEADGQTGLHPRHIAAVIGATALASLVVVGVATRATRQPVVLACTGGYLVTAAAGAVSANGLRRRRGDVVVAGLNPIGVAVAPLVAVAIDGAWGAGVLRGLLAGRFRRSGVAARTSARPKVW